jgi:hypothetical protein
LIVVTEHESAIAKVELDIFGAGIDARWRHDRCRLRASRKCHDNEGKR